MMGRVVKIPCHLFEGRNLDFGQRGSRLRGNDEKGPYKISDFKFTTASRLPVSTAGFMTTLLREAGKLCGKATSYP